ncbi:Lrp/AsnC family transcriptional regulator [Psychroflexus sp. CAK8W]|uniref:Lrp/AsnC family transcriptional regulator n=1 Tax=Psychroflexus longus TaxID=2873596 RepID=A0ABS7XJP0_9FLAO|nr:Lrp/AsnC family transcriptional regulator [Psychroflexus longus]MBZ9778624.1 Lrp/AsnC family transcriptional regulator [Psychroflexus longus]
MVDAIDHKIIDILKLNSRQSYAEIGKQVFLSPSSVRERVKKLEDTGVIKGYSIRLNQSLLGNSLEVFIMLKMFSGKLKPALAEIETYSEVKEAYRITGQHNLFIRVALKDQLHLQQFIDKLVNFGEPTTHLILSRVGKEMNQATLFKF